MIEYITPQYYHVILPISSNTYMREGMGSNLKCNSIYINE